MWPAATAVTSGNAAQWPGVSEEAWKAVVDGVLSDPCLQRWNSRLRFYIQTDFCAKGMAVVGIQPVNDPVLLDAMRHEMAGGQCEFLKDPPKGGFKDLVPRLKPVCFGSQRCKGYELRLHSYLGEGFAGDWGMGKCSHYIWGARNTWITDQCALMFLLTYNSR